MHEMGRVQSFHRHSRFSNGVTSRALVRVSLVNGQSPRISQAAYIRLQPGGKAPIPIRWFQASDMPVEEIDSTAPIVTGHGTTPVGVVARNAAGVRRVVTGIVQDPAARLFRAG